MVSSVLPAEIVPDIGVVPVYAGDDWVLPLRFKTRVGTSHPPVYEPEDLTGWTGWTAAWRPSLKSDEVIVIAVDVDLPNEVTLHATEAQTRQMVQYRNGVWDIQATRAGITRTFVKGSTSQELDVAR